jgi:hypothetical protein
MLQMAAPSECYKMFDPDDIRIGSRRGHHGSDIGGSRIDRDCQKRR